MADGGRRDGRGVGELRPCAITLGGLPGADGGASVTCGDTRVTVGVQGPRPPRGLRFESSDGAVLEIVVTSVAATPAATAALAAAEDALRAVFTPVILRAAAPRTVITIAAHVVHDAGGVLAALIVATSAAAVDAGLPLATTVVAAATAAGPVRALQPAVAGRGSGDAGGAMVVVCDPTGVEEGAAAAQGVFAFDAHALATPSATPLWCDWSASGVDGAAAGPALQAAAQAAAAATAALLRSAIAAKVARDATNYAGAAGGASS